MAEDVRVSGKDDADVVTALPLLRGAGLLLLESNGNDEALVLVPVGDDSKARWLSDACWGPRWAIKRRPLLLLFMGGETEDGTESNSSNEGEFPVYMDAYLRGCTSCCCGCVLAGEPGFESIVFDFIYAIR